MWMTPFDAVYRVMTQKRSKGFFVKMFTTWSHILNWLGFKSFFLLLLFLHWHMLILQEQYFHSSKTFLKVRTRQWENGLSKMYQDFWFFSVYQWGFSSLAPAQLGSWAYPMKLTGFTWVSLDSHLEVWTFMHTYMPSQLWIKFQSRIF